MSAGRSAFIVTTRPPHISIRHISIRQLPHYPPPLYVQQQTRVAQENESSQGHKPAKERVAGQRLVEHATKSIADYWAARRGNSWSALSRPMAETSRSVKPSLDRPRAVSSSAIGGSSLPKRICDVGTIDVRALIAGR